MLPYSWVKSLAFSLTCCSMARRSLRSSNSKPLSSAILNTKFRTPAWVSFKFSMRASNNGPISLTVARTGCPCSPNTSQSVTGLAANTGEGKPRSLSTADIFSLGCPAWLMPVKSPLTSAMNTGTPIRDRPSARVCKVTVLPEPVAPVIKPCRLTN